MTVALITDYVLEGARDGKTVAELMRDGATVIGREQVMEGWPEPTTLSLNALIWSYTSSTSNSAIR